MVSFGSTGTATLLSATIFSDYGSSSKYIAHLYNKILVVILFES
jgi:hypothetical protein